MVKIDPDRIGELIGPGGKVIKGIQAESGAEIMLGNIKSIFFSTEDLITYATHRDTLV